MPGKIDDRYLFYPKPLQFPVNRVIVIKRNFYEEVLVIRDESRDAGADSWFGAYILRS